MVICSLIRTFAHDKLSNQMKVKEFFGKFASPFLWCNLLAMLIVVVLVALGVK